MSFGVTTALPNFFADVDNHEIKDIGLVFGRVHVRTRRSDGNNTGRSVDIHEEVTSLLTQSGKLMDGGDVMRKACDSRGLQDFINLNLERNFDRTL